MTERPRLPVHHRAGVLSFDPWHGLAAHRSLGSIMRSRRAAYAHSSDFRHGVNGVEKREPLSIDELPN